ncbi:MAG: fimbrillin family protein, partial [Muribaculaceae bacterium]|nr:fimbrillin family protein [Muribaculaceae bacterium]
MSISFPFSKYLMPASFAVMIFLTACSEDSSPFSQSSEKYLRFNVEVSSGWNFPRQTRANEKQDAGKLKVLSMAYGSDSLYMVPKVIDGINLETKVFSTRSSLINKETMASFGVFASLKPESESSVENLKADYMYNVEVTRENSWSPAEEYLWPGSGSLHFNAYSPFCSEPSSSGITSLPSKDNSGTLALSYMTPEDVADQLDFLIAIPAEAASSPCDITFNHALTAIRFATGTEMTPCTVKKIEISGVNASGSVNLENGEWSRLSSPTTFSVSPEISLTAANGSKFVAPDTYITSESQTFLLIPQTLPEDAQISMTIECEGVESTMTASLAGTTWSAGKTVVYRLSANPATDSFILQIT